MGDENGLVDMLLIVVLQEIERMTVHSTNQIKACEGTNKTGKNMFLK